MATYRVVLAHGRAAEFEIPAFQSLQWAEALRFAMQRVGSRFAPDIEVDYASFGDVWRPDRRNPPPEFKTNAGTNVSVDGQAGRIIETPPPPGRKLEGLGARIGSQIADALLPDIVLGRLLRPAIPDVFEYLKQEDFRREADQRLVEKCRGDLPTILVGFSMGSIVGYNVLRDPAPELPVQAFITVGSPIGLGPINRPLRKLAKADRTPFPKYVRLWLNIWNEDDVATGVTGDDLATMFPDNSPLAGVGRRAIQNAQNFGMGASPLGPFAAHNAMDYLSSLAMGVALHTSILDIEAGRAAPDPVPPHG